MAIEVKVIWLRDQARSLRHIGTTGNSAKCCQDLFDDSMHLLPSPLVGEGGADEVRAG
jgi:hypothetical protein